MQLPQQEAPDSPALALEVDVDAVKLGFRPFAVVVHEAENVPTDLGYQELRVVGLFAACDAPAQRGDRVRLRDDLSSERGTDDVVVNCAEPDAAYRRDRRRVGDGGRSDYELR